MGQRWLDQRRGLGQPPLRRGWFLDQSSVTAAARTPYVTQEPDTTLVSLPARLAEEARVGPFAVIVRTRDEFLRWLRAPLPGAEWLQIEGLLADQEVWESAAQGPARLPLDVILTDPAAEFANLYRLVEVRIARDVRVTMPVVPGLMKALRLAVALQLPVRLLPAQPAAAELAELGEAADFYLRDPSVEAPIEFFHSAFAAMRGAPAGTLWSILERDPAIFTHTDATGQALLPRDFVAAHLRKLIEDGAECAECPWRELCAGYFKLPEPAYSCAGIKAIFARLEAAAEEIKRDLAGQE